MSIADFGRSYIITSVVFAKIKNYQKKITYWLSQLKDLRVVGLLLFLVIVLLVSWSGVKVIEANYALQKQIAVLEQENEVKKLGNTNLALENEYFATPQYLDLAARQDFGLAAPGETVVNIPRNVALAFTVDLPKSATESASRPGDELPKHQQNFQAWMDFFLNRQPSD